MIQPTAPAATAHAVSAAAIVAAQPGDSAETADFGALLTMQLQAPAAAGEGTATPTAAIPAAMAATALAATGKILPVGLPDALPPAPSEIEAQPAEPVPAPLNVAVLPASLLKARSATPAAQADSAEPSAPSEIETEAEADASLPGTDFAAMVVALPAAALPVEQAAAAPSANASAPPAAAPTAPAVLPQAAAPASTPQAAQPTAPQLATLPEAAKAEREAAVQQVRLIEPGPAQPETVFAAPQAARDAAPAALVTTPAVASTAERPHDFTALVDRLVAAREAMQPQSVTMAVRHAEFGAVQLRFQQDASGLSVAMSSADPDFARAVSAAALPVQAASASDSASFSQHGRSEAGSSGNADGSAQPRSGQQGQRDDRAAARANPSPSANRSASGSEPDGARSGIFA